MSLKQPANDPAEIEAAIRSSYLAQGLSEAQVRSLNKIARWQTFRKGEPIIEQYDQARDLLILASGTAHVLTDLGEPIGWIRPGMPMGEVALLDERTRSGTIIAVEPCAVVVLPAEPLLALLKKSPSLAAKCLYNLSRILCDRLRTANKNLAALMAIEESEIRPHR